MTARTEYVRDSQSSGARTIALTVLLGFVMLAGFIGFVAALGPVPMRWTWQRIAIAAVSLLVIAGAFRSMSRLPFSSTRGFTLICVLGGMAFYGFTGTWSVVKAGIALDLFREPWTWHTFAIVAKNLLMLVVAIIGFVWLKPWKQPASDEPLSPRTRRTNMLFALSGLVTLPGMLALVYATSRNSTPIALFSNSAISPEIASFAIVSLMLGMAISWWWYFTADEHERHAYDFGTLVAGGMFLTVTPAWWIAARAGFLPQPDAMLLWVVTISVATIGWGWRRSR